MLISRCLSDDTSVAVLEKHDDVTQIRRGEAATLHFHQKITADNRRYRGIHPVVTLESHRAHLAHLLSRALLHLPECAEESKGAIDRTRTVATLSPSGHVLRRKPDFVSVTRGPGMLPSLACGLDTAKGLAVAWCCPLVGVHHMQAHALTPRLASALTTGHDEPSSRFPFLSLLVSGGHTLLIHSKGLAAHDVLATPHDVAVGDCLDKIARVVLPKEVLEATTDTMYGRTLSSFAWPNGQIDFQDYLPPASRGEEVAGRPPNGWGWSLRPALAETRTLAFSFSGLQSRICQLVAMHGRDYIFSAPERRAFAREALRIAFEHLASRTVIALQHLQRSGMGVETLVVSGGVAANSFLRHVFRAFLAARGFPAVQVIFPPVEFCTDNAAMIAWAGVEMYQAGHRSDLSIGALRKWSLGDVTI